MQNTTGIIEYIDQNMTSSRRIHTDGVVLEAIKLANFYGADSEKVSFAALCHDMARDLPLEKETEFIERFGLSKRYYGKTNLAHGKIAAELLEKEFGITDKEILNAVSFHTTGRPGMTDFEKIVYLADAIEPLREYPGVEVLRTLAMIDLDRACLFSMENTIAYVISNGETLDNETLTARDWIKSVIAEKERNKYEQS